MRIFGQTGNANSESLQSLGAIANGNVHTFTRFRMAGDGASLHPLQRSGSVSAESHAFMPSHARPSETGFGASAYPAADFNMTLPPVVSIPGDPRFQIA